jgi:hypothetical protein
MALFKVQLLNDTGVTPGNYPSANITVGADGRLTAASVGSAIVIPGSVIWFASNSSPSGYLFCNGATISRTTYSDLFATIGTTFGAGDGSTTFQIPDLRGEFVRGWDSGRGLDSGRVFGSSQSDAFASHYHGPGVAPGLNGFWVDWVNGTTPVYEVAQAPGSGIWLRSVGNTTSAGGTETRPVNVALLPCIKY